MAQVVEPLSSKHKVLNSNPSTAKKGKERTYKTKSRNSFKLLLLASITILLLGSFCL
jgi:hypothetical protein